MDEHIDPVVFQVGTKEYKLVLTAPAIRLFEEKTGKGIFQADIPGNVTQTVTLLWAAASTHSPHLRLDKLFEYVSPANIPAINEALGECLKRAFGVEEERETKAGEEARPLGS
jgi:hypothetical protein